MAYDVGLGFVECRYVRGCNAAGPRSSRLAPTTRDVVRVQRVSSPGMRRTGMRDSSGALPERLRRDTGPPSEGAMKCRRFGVAGEIGHLRDGERGVREARL